MIHFFSTSPHKFVFRIDARMSPLMLIGLSNYLLELKLDRTSILQKYYQNRKFSFTIEEDEVSLLFMNSINYKYFFRNLFHLNPIAKPMKLS